MVGGMGTVVGGTGTVVRGTGTGTVVGGTGTGTVVGGMVSVMGEVVWPLSRPHAATTRPATAMPREAEEGDGPVGNTMTTTEAGAGGVPGHL